jgi:hypothetical protein
MRLPQSAVSRAAVSTILFGPNEFGGRRDAIIGPQIGASLMARFKIDGASYFMAAAVPLLAIVAGLGTFDDASLRAPGSALCDPSTSSRAARA